MAKQHKYIYKKYVNGKWRYWYKDTKSSLEDLINKGKEKLEELLKSLGNNWDKITKQGLHAEEIVMYGVKGVDGKTNWHKGTTAKVGKIGKTVTPIKKASQYQKDSSDGWVTRATVDKKKDTLTSFQSTTKPEMLVTNKAGETLSQYKAKNDFKKSTGFSFEDLLNSSVSSLLKKR